MFRVYVILEILCVICCLHFLYMHEMGKNQFKIIPSFALMVCQSFIFELAYVYNYGQNLSWIMLPVIAAYTIVEFDKCLKKVFTSNILCILVISLLQLLARSSCAILGIDGIPDDQMAILVYSLTLIFLILLRNKVAQFFSFILVKNKIIMFFGILYTVYLLASIISFKKKGGIDLIDFLILFIFGIGICLLAYSLQNEKAKMEIMQKKLETYQNHGQNYGKLLESVRRKQHDFHNHIQAILSMCYTAKGYEELVEQQMNYINMVMKENPDYKLLNSQWPLLAGFIYSKIQEALKSNILVRYNVKFVKRVNRIPEPVMVEIIGIIFDNAIEAVSGMENPILYIDISENKNFYIIVANPIPKMNMDDIQQFFQEGYSTKEGHEGYGLSKIKEYSECYKFKYVVRKENIANKDFYFMSIII